MALPYVHHSLQQLHVLDASIVIINQCISIMGALHNIGIRMSVSYGTLEISPQYLHVPDDDVCNLWLTLFHITISVLSMPDCYLNLSHQIMDVAYRLLD